MSEPQPHSAEYFGETRDHWWNDDFLDLMARRWRLDEVRTALDLGSGLGHWTRLVGRRLHPEATILGIDGEQAWVLGACAIAARRGESERYAFQLGDVTKRLPFEDGTFDLVTCQTVLIHVPDPAAVVAEMARVTRPGGLVAVAEPNNLAACTLLDTETFGAPAEEIIALARFQLICERGKAALGEGNNSVGGLTPAFFAAAGLEAITVHLSDKGTLLLPPYASAEAKAERAEITDRAAKDQFWWDRALTTRYFAAGGGDENELDALFAMGRRTLARVVAAMDRGTYVSAGGGLSYLVAGRVPAARP